MKRIAVLNGFWFDADKAEFFKENTWHDGNNFISKSTGCQWEHEDMYLTKGGKFISKRWSNYQGRGTVYEVVSNEYASEWFVKNEFSNDEIPTILHDGVSSLELK